jgi:sporulation protein YlmC with PRC-barrel domain
MAPTADRAPQSAAGAAPLIALTTVLGNKVVTDAGTLVGELQDVLLDWANLTITGYEVREGGVFAKTQEFTATPDLRFGEKIITMPAQLLSQPA